MPQPPQSDSEDRLLFQAIKYGWELCAVGYPKPNHFHECFKTDPLLSRKRNLLVHRPYHRSGATK